MTFMNENIKTLTGKVIAILFFRKSLLRLTKNVISASVYLYYYYF